MASCSNNMSDCHKQTTQEISSKPGKIVSTEPKYERGSLWILLKQDNFLQIVVKLYEEAKEPFFNPFHTKCGLMGSSQNGQYVSENRGNINWQVLYKQPTEWWWRQTEFTIRHEYEPPASPLMNTSSQHDSVCAKNKDLQWWFGTFWKSNT